MERERTELNGSGTISHTTSSNRNQISPLFFLSPWEPHEGEERSIEQGMTSPWAPLIENVPPRLCNYGCRRDGGEMVQRWYRDDEVF